MRLNRNKQWDGTGSCTWSGMALAHVHRGWGLCGMLAGALLVCGMLWGARVCSCGMALVGLSVFRIPLV